MTPTHTNQHVVLSGLRQDAVHLYLAKPSRVLTAQRAAVYQTLLTPDETERWSRFHFQRDRDLFLTTRALVRCVLSSHADVAPDKWRFTANEYGRPEILTPELKPSLYFNLSHTAGTCCCVVAACPEVGVDAENVDRRVDDGVVKSVMSSAEQEYLAGLTGADRGRAFYELWTLKEAYVKARGSGMSLPLQAISFAAIRDQPRISFVAPIFDDAASWHFFRFDAEATVAIAVRKTTAAAPQVIVREVVPQPMLENRLELMSETLIG